MYLSPLLGSPSNIAAMYIKSRQRNNPSLRLLELLDLLQFQIQKNFTADTIGDLDLTVIAVQTLGQPKAHKP